MADGNVDATFALSGYPSGAVMQAQANTKLKYIPLTEDDIATALEKFPNYNNETIPADVYNTESDGSPLGVNIMLVVDAGMSDDVAMKIAAAIYDNMDAFRAENAHVRQIEPERSLQLRIPLHPGAKAYFKK